MSDDGRVDLADLLTPQALAIRVQFAKDVANVEAAMNASDEQIAELRALAESMQDDPA